MATPSEELGPNPTTVAIWRRRETVEDRKTGTKKPLSTADSIDVRCWVFIDSQRRAVKSEIITGWLGLA
jgi:hypothetical protein